MFPYYPRRTGRTDRRHLPRASRVLVLGVIAVLLAALTACDQEAPNEEALPGVCGTSDDEYCYDLGNIANFYCHIGAVRDEVAEGRLAMGDLPKWAIEDPVPDGSPRIYDFRQPDPDGKSDAQRHDQLEAAIIAAEGSLGGVDSDAIDRCIDSITQERVHDSEGGWATYPPGGRSTE